MPQSARLPLAQVAKDNARPLLSDHVHHRIARPRTRGERKRNVLLFNFSGYPEYTSFFIVDNGLAYLAAHIQRLGHRVQVDDRVTLETAERLWFPEYAAKVQLLRRAVDEELERDGRISGRTFSAALETDALVRERETSEARAIGRELSRKIADQRIDLLGVKLWTQPSMHAMREILDEVRAAHPTIEIVVGGGHVDYFLSRVLSDLPAVDGAVYGDGEMGLMGWLAASAGRLDFRDVPGLIWRGAEGAVTNPPLDNPNFPEQTVIPSFSQEMYPAAAGGEKMLSIAVEDSRGCQYACGFCAHPVKSGMMRLREVESLLHEMERLNEEHGFVHFFGAGSNTPFTHARRIYESMYQRRFDVAAGFFQSLRDFNLDKAGIFRNVHIPLIWVGLETASQDLLSGPYDKRRDMERTKRVCEFFNEARIGYILSVIFPSLGETEKSAKETLDFLKHVGLGRVVIYPPLVQPRTPWMDSESLQWVDRELFMESSMYGLEERENKVLPPMVSDRGLNESVRINGKSYKEIYYESVQWRQTASRVAGDDRGHERYLEYTPEMSTFMSTLNYCFADIDDALESGEFEVAQLALDRFNRVATAGSIEATRTLQKERRQAVLGERRSDAALRTGGPA